jgi:hypothetical protein
MQLNSQKATRENAQGCVGHNVSQPKLRTLLHGFRELARRTVASDMCGTYCSRVDDIASSSIVARTPKRPARTEITLNHQFCARPGAFTSMGSRLNLYCGVEEGEEGGYRSALGLGGVTERRIDIRDVSVGPRESRRGYPRAIHPRDRRNERSPLRGFSSVGYVVNLGGGALTVSWLRSFVHHLCVFVG